MLFQSKSKINLGLKVLNKRSDGLHNIVTIFQEVDFGDKIELDDSIEILAFEDAIDNVSENNNNLKNTNNFVNDA